MEKILKISSLIKERELLLKKVGDVEKTKAWTQIDIKGEDGAEHSHSFSFGGTGDNNKENLALAKEIHDLIKTNFEARLEVVNAEIEKLLK